MSSPATKWLPEYPERSDTRESTVTRVTREMARAWARIPNRGAERPSVLGRAVRELQAPLRSVEDSALRAAARACGAELARLSRREAGALAWRADRRALELECFALVREAARRTLAMEHYDSQLAAGAALLRGAVVEMPTGEGKTLAATLAACVQALAGVPVHVITVNDYLAERDAAWMGPIYRMLGISVGVVTAGLDAAARRRAYACDVTYCCNKELVFDYLRDRRAKGGRTTAHLQFERLYGRRARVPPLLLRGLHSAIVDEADSVLIDETRTPLILSQPGQGADQAAIVQAAIELARGLAVGLDYGVDVLSRRVELTVVGRAHLRRMTEGRGGLWARPRWSDEIVARALAALTLYRRDEHYLVRDGSVVVIDEHSGRAMPGRSWSQGLHQLIEAKEGVEITREPETLARISYQRFFRRYLQLAGMTGTASEAAAELWSVYGLRVVPVAPHVPSRQCTLGERVFARVEDKWTAVVARIAELHATGRPVLVGTASVAASERLSGLLDAAALPHETLNARQDSREAAVIARAGERGRITVATNMAGRGTDIRLGSGVVELGGLHVIATERHEAGRIDRQLFGRAARQGDPGSCEYLISLEDPVLERVGGWPGGRRLRELVAWTLRFGSGPAAALLRAAQRRTERVHARARKLLLRADHRLDDRLAFSGPAE